MLGSFLAPPTSSIPRAASHNTINVIKSKIATMDRMNMAAVRREGSFLVSHPCFHRADERVSDGDVVVMSFAIQISHYYYHGEREAAAPLRNFAISANDFHVSLGIIRPPLIMVARAFLHFMHQKDEELVLGFDNVRIVHHISSAWLCGR